MAWLAIAALIGSLIVSLVFQPKIQTKTQKPQEVKSPIVEEGKEFQVVFGTMMLRDPNIAWFGDIKTVAVKK